MIRINFRAYYYTNITSKITINVIFRAFHYTQIFSKMNTVHRGALIVFEGVDRSGKSTQSKMLVESLRKLGEKAERMVFPDRTTPIGQIISEYLSNKNYELNDRAIHLLFAANRFEKMSKMKKLLTNGVNVIVDRYSYSGIVFSAAKKGMDIEWCKSPETGLLAPDLVFLLTLSSEEMKRRPGFGEERYENAATQLRVLEEYNKLANQYQFNKINAEGKEDVIQSVILRKSLEVIKCVGNSELKYLDFIGKRNSYIDNKENNDSSVNVNVLMKNV